MKTEVIMKRESLGEIISQKSKSGFFSATDLVRTGNKYRVVNGLDPTSLNTYFNSSSSKEFMKELEKKYGKIKTSGRGRKPSDKSKEDKTITWVHPLLFLDIALWIDPKMKVEVYEWLMDNLLKFRNESGTSYKKMVGALFSVSKDKSNFSKNIKLVAKYIKLECDVKDWNEASEYQLELRDKMHEYVAFTCDMVKDGKMALEIGVKKAKQVMKEKH